MHSLVRPVSHVVLFLAALCLSFLPALSLAEPVKVVATAQGADGRIVVVGIPTADPPTVRRIAVGRLLENGSTDASFGSNGWSYLEAPPATATEFVPTAVMVAQSGQVVAAALVDGKVALVRVNVDGQPDNGFGFNGVVVDPDGAGYRANAIAQMPDGGYLTAGSYRATPSDYSDTALIRYIPSGQRMPSWGTLGVVVLPLSTGDNEARAMLPVEDGKFVLAGSVREIGSNSDFLVARVDANGALDTTFGAGGRTTWDYLNFDDEANAIVRLGSGKIAVGGRAGHSIAPNSQDLFGVIKLHPDGAFDTAFGYQGSMGVDIAVDGAHDADSAVTALVAGPRADDFIAGGVARRLLDGQSYFTVLNFPSQVGYPPLFNWQSIGPRTSARDEIVGLHANAEWRVVAVGSRTLGGATTDYRVRYVTTSGFLETDFGAVNDTPDTDAVIRPSEFYVFEGVGTLSEVTWPLDVNLFNAPLRISVQNGEWSLNCDWMNYTSQPGWILLDGTRVCIRHIAAPNPATMTETHVTIGSWQATATSITYGSAATIFPQSPLPWETSTTATYTLYSTASPAEFECALDGAPYQPCTSPVVMTDLAQGQHEFSARSRYVPNGVWGYPTSQIWRIDSFAPETTITAGPPSVSSSSTASFDFSSNETYVEFQCRMDGGDWQPCGSGWPFSGLSEGNHVFEVRALDVAGNVDATPASYAWTISYGPPETTLTSGPSGITTSTTEWFGFTATPPDGATFECSMDGAAFAPCTVQTQFSVGHGTHTFRVRAVNALGMADPTPASRTWSVDIVGPVVSIDSGPSPISTAPFTFTFSSPEPGVTFQCRERPYLNYVSCASPFTYYYLPEGSYTVEVRAIDSLGNATATPATWSFVVDNTIPQTTITSGPPALTSSQVAAFTFTTNEGTSTFECRLDGAAFAPCTSPASYPGVADGSHVFEVRAVDAAGNTDDTPASHAWTIDADQPDTLITSGPPASTPSTSAAFTFGADEPGVTFECALDGAAFSSCVSPVAYSGLAQGGHVFEVRAIDTAGNVDPTPGVHAWTVTDTTAPDTTITGGPSGPTNQTSATFTFTASEGGATFECRRDGQAYAACTSPKAYTGLAVGNHTFDVRAVDSSGNADASPATRSWTIDTTAPNTTITSAPVNNTTSTTATFSFTSTEPGSTFECRMDSGAWTACTSPATYTGLTRTTHTFRVRARDAAGNTDGTPATHTWRIR